MTKYRYGLITPVNDDWFIVQVMKEGVFKKEYILVGRSELTHILVNGVSQFMDDTKIRTYSSRKSIVRRYSKEPAYAHLFETTKWFT